MQKNSTSRFFAISTFALLLLGSALYSNDAYADRPRITAKKAGLEQLKKAIRKRGVGALSGDLAASIVKRERRSRTQRLIQSVSGTPPTLMSLGNEDSETPIKEVFWREVDGENVVDALLGGSPTQAQCSEFWSSVNNGGSGGLGACDMAESVGRGLGVTSEAFNSLCYMSNFPVESNLDSGGVSIVNGELPEGGLPALFAPGVESRVVKVLVNDERGSDDNQINLKVYSQSENAAAGRAYRVDITFCNELGEARGYNRIEISNGGALDAETAEASPDGGSIHKVDVTGFLQAIGGRVALDPSRPRNASAEFIRSGGDDIDFFKGDIEVTGGAVRVRSYDTGGGSYNSADRITRFTGSTPETIRFTEGAFQSQRTFDGSTESFSGAVEYRNSYYASNPQSELLEEIDGSFNDLFYSPPTTAVDTTGYECVRNEDAAVVINLDMNDEAVRESVAACEERPFDDMHFCYGDDQIRIAMAYYHYLCGGGE